MATEQRITFAAGCFWGVEAGFHIRGVVATRVGYMGGHVDHPTHAQVATNQTGHAEVVEVAFDPDIAWLWKLFGCFWNIHDPTAVPRDAPGNGHRYRSAVFFRTPEQQREAHDWIAAMQAECDAPLMTEVVPVSRFWPAAPEHQDRYERRGLFQIGLWPEGLDSDPYVHQRQGGVAAIDLDLLEATGPAFSGHFHTDILLRAFDGNRLHVDAALGALRRSLEARSASGRRRHGGYPVVRSSLAVAPSATETQLCWMFDDVEHTFVVNLQPGNFHPRPVWVGKADKEAEARPVDGAVPELSQRGGRSGSGSIGPIGQLPRGPSASSRQRRPDKWYAHLPEVTEVLRLPGGKHHELTWREGKLHLDAHPKDTVEETTLQALGAPGCPCYLVLEIWRNEWLAEPHASSLLQTSFSSTMVAAPATCLHSRVADWSNDHGPARPRPQSGNQRLTHTPTAADALRLLHRLPFGMQQRWLLGTLVSLERRRHALNRWDRANLMALALRPLRSTVLRTLWRWCRFEPAISYGEIDCRLLEATEAAHAHGAIDGARASISIGVPFRWLTHTWARGLAAVGDHLIIDVDGPAEAANLDVTAVGWRQPKRGAAVLEAKPTTVHWDGGRWHLGC